MDKAQLSNYKSFARTDRLTFQPGVNIIVGQNNVGKTALLEGLTVRFDNAPHRSLLTVPTPQASPPPVSSARLTVWLEPGELANLIARYSPTFWLPFTSPIPNDKSQVEEQLRTYLSEAVSLHISYENNTFRSAWLDPYPFASISNLTIDNSINSIQVQWNHSNNTPELMPMTAKAIGFRETLPYISATPINQRIYLFRAERLNVSEYGMNANDNLAPDASNLAQVLNFLQGRNSTRYRRLMSLLSQVFPDITEVGVPPIDTQKARIMIWSNSPELEREDLAIPLAASGTGIGQALAMLYVMLTSDFPRTILIDEPTSFLHPGAVRKLLSILKSFSQHQLIISTHSPTVISATNSAQINLITKHDGASIVSRINTNETSDLSSSLAEIGARLSDVFGADNILWVEGPTEERCFPLLLEAARRPMLGTVILGVLHTSDFDKRSAEWAVQIYERLSRGPALLPPGIGFVFDRESRSQDKRDDLIKRSNGRVHFLQRRMYENYLLNPRAIAAVTGDLPGFRDSPLPAVEVDRWLQEHHRQPDAENWRVDADGAALLDLLFKETSEHRYSYKKDKVVYGVALTKWLLENEPEELTEITNLLLTILPGADDTASAS